MPGASSLRELLVGLLNGAAFAVITGVAAYVWFRVPDLGFVIGLAMVCNLLAAALGGILIPLTLARLRVDPAVASSPFVTTVTDVVGFFSFLSHRHALVRAAVGEAKLGDDLFTLFADRPLTLAA